MPVSSNQQTTRAHAQVGQGADCLQLTLGGDWRITDSPPRWHAPRLPKTEHARVRVVADTLGSWDSSLLLYLNGFTAWAHSHALETDLSALPARTLELLGALQATEKAPKPKEGNANILHHVGVQSGLLWRQCIEISNFVGELSLSAARLIRKPASFRWKDFLGEAQQCGAMALPIVSLISFLMGVTLAYTSATILRLFGGDIWVADLIGLSVTREMAAVMTAVVLAGRTGAAFAAQIANMKANEEIDALSTLGVSASDFLVMPRILALAVMTPLLTLYANLLGILGGMIIALFILSIPPSAYWVEMLTIVDLSDVVTGLIKASTFGIIIGLSGCLRGLQADRSAEGVGKAATSSVVTAILLMVLADAFYAVLFNLLGW